MAYVNNANTNSPPIMAKIIIHKGSDVSSCWSINSGYALVSTYNKFYEIHQVRTKAKIINFYISPTAVQLSAFVLLEIPKEFVLALLI